MIIIDGQPVHPAVAAALKLLDAGFYTATGQHLRVTSGYRSKAAQAKLFLTRYRVQWAGRGAYNDVRWWKGKRYVRHSGAGTVAVPGTSLHESFRALDIRDTGKDSGVTTAGTVRSNWIKKNAHLYGFNPRGLTFGEPWHIEYTGSLTQTSGDITPTDASGDITPTETGDDEMKPVILTNSKGIGIIINWAEGTWRGLYGSETKAHKANGNKVTKALSDKDFEDIKAQLRPWTR